MAASILASLAARIKCMPLPGPSCQDVDTLEKLIRSGMCIARLNFSHGSHEVSRHAGRKNARDIVSPPPPPPSLVPRPEYCKHQGSRCSCSREVCCHSAGHQGSRDQDRLAEGGKRKCTPTHTTIYPNIHVHNRHLISYLKWVIHVPEHVLQ